MSAPAPISTAVALTWMSAPATVLDTGARPTTANISRLIVRPSSAAGVRICSQVTNWMTT